MFLILLTQSSPTSLSQDRSIQDLKTLPASSLDPQCRAFLDAASAQPPTDREAMDPGVARRSFASLKELFGTGPEDVRTEDYKINSTIPVRLYKPKSEVSSANLLPVVMYFHGGGWVLGDIETHDALCRRLCHESRSAIVSVGYRLAPENAFPAPFDDCYVATDYISTHGGDWNLDASRLIVAGDSAGANLAAGVAIKARNIQGPKILAQVLLYPALDPGCDSASFDQFPQGYGLTKADMLWFWKAYLGNHKPNAYSAPLNADSFASLPKTLIVTAQYDVLRDDGEQFARKLELAGVAVSHHRYEKMIHGFVHFSGAIDVGKIATTRIAQWIKRVTEKTSNP